MNYANNQYITERYMLDPWPLFALGDGGDIAVLRSDTLVRVQVYAALAYGARGLYYYCWGHGIWNMPPGNQQGGRGSPTVNYPTVKATNADAAVWGAILIGSRHVGAIRSAPVEGDHSVVAMVGLAVESMDGGLLVGVFSDGSSSDNGYLMVVDLRSSMNQGGISPRQASLTVAASCQATVVKGGPDGWSSLHPHTPAVGSQQHSGKMTLTLAGGGGALLKVSGKGCGEILRFTRQWWTDPRTLSLRGGTPGPSPKSATYDAWGAANRRHQPGGLAGTESDFIIGGSYHETGGGFASATEAQEWAKAGFLVASLPVGNASAIIAALGYGMAYGTFVVATQQEPTGMYLDPMPAKVLITLLSIQPPD